MPYSPSQPLLSSSIAWSTADGVGMRMSDSRPVTRDRPLAWTIRFRKISRILLWVGSMFSTPNFGMTLGQIYVVWPDKIRSHSRAAVRLPAMTMGKSGGSCASMFAL